MKPELDELNAKIDDLRKQLNEYIDRNSEQYLATLRQLNQARLAYVRLEMGDKSE